VTKDGIGVGLEIGRSRDTDENEKEDDHAPDLAAMGPTHRRDRLPRTS
jgi:hypothetical protein